MTLQAALNATDWNRLNRLLEQALEVEAGKRLDWIRCLPPEEADLKPVNSQPRSHSSPAHTAP